MPSQGFTFESIVFLNIGNLICGYTVILVHCSVTNIYNLLSYFIILYYCYIIK